MTIAVNLPKFLWTEAIKHATWLKNHISTSVLDGCTPYEVLRKEKPNLGNVPEWGTKAWILK
jgi:hypothetical protein